MITSKTVIIFTRLYIAVGKIKYNGKQYIQKHKWVVAFALYLEIT